MKLTVLALSACLVSTMGGDGAAQAPGTLNYGVFPDLQDCYLGKPGTCKKAATGLGMASWNAHLMGSTTAPPDAEGRLFHGLECASKKAASCARLGDMALSEGKRLYGTVLLVEACEYGDTASCARLGHGGMPGGTNVDQTLWARGSGAALVPKADDFDDLAESCGKKDQPLKTCLDLANVYNARAQASLAAMKAAVALAREACGDGHSAACELQAAATDTEGPLDPAFRDAAALLLDVCAREKAARACDTYARLIELGRAHAYGTYQSRRGHGYACNGGLDWGCNRLTEVYETPIATRLQETCDAADGDARACTEAYTMSTFGIGMPKDAARAEQLKDKACDRGDLRPCVWRGNTAWKDDKLTAYQWYKKACDAGDGVSCGVVGRMEVKAEGGVRQDMTAGIKHMQRGCDLGAGSACFELGYSYSQARGVTKDSKRAALLYSRSCSGGYVNACSSLGVLYMDGRGVPVSRAYSEWLLRNSCDRGFGSSCRNLGNGYLDGLREFPVDRARARWAYDAGCKLEHKDSCERQAKVTEAPLAPESMGTRPPLIHTMTRTPSQPTSPSRPTPATPSTPSTPSKPGRYSSGPSITQFAFGWTGTQLVMSLRDKSKLLTASDRDRTSDARFTYAGIDMGAILGGPQDFGLRIQLAASVDWLGMFDDEVSNSPRYGGLYLEAAADGIFFLGDSFMFGLGIGWHGLSGPITKNSSMAGSIFLVNAPSEDELAFYIRVTPVQLFAANEREFLSPLTVEFRAATSDLSFGLEFQYIGAPEAGDEDIEAEAWALLFRIGTAILEID